MITTSQTELTITEMLDLAYARGYAAGMADSDGSLVHASGHSTRAGAKIAIVFSQTHRGVLEILQQHLVTLGMASHLTGPHEQANRNPMYRLKVTEQSDILKFLREVGFRQFRRAARAENYLRGRPLTSGDGA